jgi:predicted negative regulator of RcsB-dependent stress response
LGDIAWRLHDTNAAIQNYTACLANAPTNLAESTLIRQHLADLKAPAH